MALLIRYLCFALIIAAVCLSDTDFAPTMLAGAFLCLSILFDRLTRKEKPLNLASHAATAANLQSAAIFASGINDNLQSIAAGSASGNTKAAQVDEWFRKLAEILGYTVTKEAK